MIFNILSERYFSGSDSGRAAATLEFVSFAGNAIAAGESVQQSTFIARGDGTLELRRRGDFMERGEAFPGVWTARCAPSELSEVWDKLGDLGPDSFPARAADPGEGRSRLSACVPPLSETLEWGPPDHSRPAPGTAFMSALVPLIVKAGEGDPLWSVEMRPPAISRSPGGLTVEVELLNHGSQPIGFVLPLASQGGGFKLRQAPAREVPPGVTPLPVSWNWEDLFLPDQKSPALWMLTPETPLRIRLESEAELSPGRTYVGKLEYEQPVYLDRFVGRPVLSGACFTSSFRFEV
jgi:hypothetical protein